MAQLQLLQTSTVVLNGSGAGTCPSIGPTAQGEKWTVTTISVQCNTNTNEAIARVFLNGSLLGATTWGSTGDSDTGINQAVMTGQTINATWTGGDAGATAKMSVLGTREV